MEYPKLVLKKCELHRGYVWVDPTRLVKLFGSGITANGSGQVAWSKLYGVLADHAVCLDANAFDWVFGLSEGQLVAVPLRGV